VARVRGSHHIMRHADGRGTTVPVHQGREVAKGTLRGILSDIGMSVEDLPRLLRPGTCNIPLADRDCQAHSGRWLVAR
jgi:hypothetical protein